MRLTPIHLILLTTLLSTAGCGHSSEPHPASGEVHRLSNGKISQALLDLQNNEWAETCDKRSDRARILEMARDLDAREAEVEEVARNLPPSKTYRRVPLGPTFVREIVTPQIPNPGWSEDVNSWELLYEDYLRIKNQPTNRAWVSLHSQARYLLIDDQDRVLEGVNLYLNRDSGPILKKILALVAQCQTDESCLRLDFTPQQEIFIQNNPYESWYLNHLHQELRTREKRILIGKFLKRLESDSARFVFRPNKTVSHASSSQLLLPLDGTVFSGAETALAHYIEDIWQKPGLQLKINWVKSAELPDVFKILLGEGAGARSFVDFNDRIVQLYPDVRTKSIAHEIGHVLGFKDHYYTVWHPDKCSYVTQARDDDLMSGSDTGKVTEEEWAEIETTYPAR